MKILVLLSIITALSLGFMSYKFTRAYFTASAISATNVFQAAAEFTPSQPVTENGHAVISEVQVASDSAGEDFVELYNPTDQTINLNGYRIVRRSAASTTDDTLKVFNNDDTIRAHGFFLWANSANGYAASIGADKSSTLNITDDNSIALRNGPENTGTIIDAVGYGTPGGTPLTEGAPFPTNPGPNQSLERKALSTSTASSMAIGGADEFKGNGFDNDNNATDFVLRAVSQPQNSSSAEESL